MESNAIKFALHVSDTVTIVNWLDSKGVKTRVQASNWLRPFVGANLAFGADGSAIGGEYGSLKKGLDKIGKHYKD